MAEPGKVGQNDGGHLTCATDRESPYEGNPTAVIRILVADGHDDTRSLYRKSLGRVGCEVADGRDALVEALSRPPTLVITETVLPMVDGFALWRRAAPRFGDEACADSRCDDGVTAGGTGSRSRGGAGVVLVNRFLRMCF